MTGRKTTLGELEQRIMDAVWSRGTATVRDVLRDISGRRAVAYTTVMTVMNRLVAAGCLRRSPTDNGAYTYTPTRSREDFSALAARQSIERLVAQYGDTVIVQFMEQLDRIPADKLAKLRKNKRK